MTLKNIFLFIIEYFSSVHLIYTMHYYNIINFYTITYTTIHEVKINYIVKLVFINCL